MAPQEWCRHLLRTVSVTSYVFNGSSPLSCSLLTLIFSLNMLYLKSLTQAPKSYCGYDGWLLVPAILSAHAYEDLPPPLYHQLLWLWGHESHGGTQIIAQVRVSGPQLIVQEVCFSQVPLWWRWAIQPEPCAFMFQVWEANPGWSFICRNHFQKALEDGRRVRGDLCPFIFSYCLTRFNFLLYQAMSPHLCSGGSSPFHICILCAMGSELHTECMKLASYHTLGNTACFSVECDLRKSTQIYSWLGLNCWTRSQQLMMADHAHYLFSALH
jgi:hypothetical protein